VWTKLKNLILEIKNSRIKSKLHIMPPPFHQATSSFVSNQCYISQSEKKKEKDIF